MIRRKLAGSLTMSPYWLSDIGDPEKSSTLYLSCDSPTHRALTGVLVNAGRKMRWNGVTDRKLSHSAPFSQQRPVQILD